MRVYYLNSCRTSFFDEISIFDTLLAFKYGLPRNRGFVDV